MKWTRYKDSETGAISYKSVSRLTGGFLGHTIFADINSRRFDLLTPKGRTEYHGTLKSAKFSAEYPHITRG